MTIKDLSDPAVSTRIHRLSNTLANHIAAGEVVERPASILKELLENSLDAGATQIDIHIEGGGIGLIRVQDNGMGICKDDLALALAQHATSKIHQLSDLEGIASYGFRGEALASMAAVSQLRLSSWVPLQAQGWSASVEGRSGEMILTPAATQPGTCVEVRHLFYNTPARRCFLRSERTEALYVEALFKGIALSNPSVAFSFTQNNGVRKRFPAATHLASQRQRVGLIAGQRFIQDAAYLEAEVHGFKLHGYVGSMDAMRSQADLQYFYVNRRMVRDKVINHAIRKAYGDRIPVGRHPAYVLYFDLDLRAVDVNVHPTKHEVRFRDTRSVHDFLVYALEEGLKQSECDTESVQRDPSPLEGEGGAKPRMRGETMLDVPLTPRCAGPSPSRGEGSPCTTPSFPRKRESSQDNHAIADLNPVTADAPALTASTPSVIASVARQSSMSAEVRSTKEDNTLLFPETQLFLIKIQEPEPALMIVDLKRSRELWIERSLSEHYQTHSIESRPLLWPLSFKVKHAENLSTGPIDWERLGFDASPIDVDQILLRALPACMGIKSNTLIEDGSFGAFLSTLLQSSHLASCIAQIAHYASQYPLPSEEACDALFAELQQSPWFMNDGISLGCYKVVALQDLRDL